MYTIDILKSRTINVKNFLNMEDLTNVYVHDVLWYEFIAGK